MSSAKNIHRGGDGKGDILGVDRSCYFNNSKIITGTYIERDIMVSIFSLLAPFYYYI